MTDTTTTEPEVRRSADPRRLAALGGVVAGAAGVATSELATGVLHLASSPLVAIASAVRDLTPGGLAVSLVHLVGHLDKPLLILGTVVVFLLVAGGAGVAAVRRPWVGHTVFSVLAVLGGLAVEAQDGSGPADLLPVIVGWFTWIAVLPLLAPPTGPRDEVGRRAMLRKTAIVGGGAVVAVVLGRVLEAGRAKVEQARDLLRLPVTKGTVTAGASLPGGTDVPWRTPSDSFYLIDTTISTPQLTPSDWELRIHGMVDRPITLSYRDLVSRDMVQKWVTLCCVSNEVGGDLIGNAYWSGFPIRDILAEAGVQAGADAVKQTSVDGWTCGTPLEALTDPDRDAMLAVAMNGEPLPIEHGFPVRMVVPGLYGYVSATKWVVDLEVTRFADFTAYWTDRGWGVKGPVKTESRIDVPRSGEGVKPGRVTLGGSAWAQHTGISKVEVQVDGGAWQEATLGTVPDVDTWVQWKVEAEVKAGDHVAMVRATDRSGYTQTAAKADVLPDGATGWHTVSFTAG